MNRQRKKTVKEVGRASSRYSLSDPLRELYTSAGQYYATSLLAVIFGQFTVLALLAAKASHIGYWGATLWLVVVHGLIVLVGCYFVFRAAIFAQLEEDARNRSNLGQLDAEMRKRVGNLNSRLEGLRLRLIKLPLLLSAAYAVFSAVALVAVLYLPP